MNLAQLLSVDQILPDMRSREHLGAIAELVDLLESKQLLGGLSKAGLIQQFYQREEQISTGVGSGVAIPHTFVEGLDRVITAFGRSHSGIDFGALDDAPVYFVVLFVVPKTDYHLHLQTLAAIARLFTSSEVRQALTGAEDAREILEIFSRRPART